MRLLLATVTLPHRLRLRLPHSGGMPPVKLLPARMREVVVLFDRLAKLGGSVPAIVTG